MGVIKKKPYEISMWEDRLVEENGISYYKEIKLAVIGSDKMESPNRVFDPVLIENVNGEKTLTFSLAYKYFDDFRGEMVNNPFYPYLINERKIKLFYNDEWFEFLIKECEEGTDDYIFNYTAQELFSLELSKLGYDVVLDTSLNNNQGTIIELAKKVLKNTDWEVDEENSDLLTQYVQDPLYKATVLVNNIQILNLDTNEPDRLNEGEVIYIFYSYINNKTTEHVQFIRESDRNKYFIDDDNVIKSTNYRFIDTIEYETDGDTITGIKNIATLDSLYYSNQGYRLVYKIQTTYDPIMDRTVDVYQAKYDDGAQEIYHFLDYDYSTSDIVVSYMTNGSNFNVLDDGSLQGWSNKTDTSTDEGAPVLQPMRLTTYPEVSNSGKLSLTNALSEINGYLELKFKGALTEDYKNAYFNSGFNDSTSTINHISTGEEFVLRTRYYTSPEKHGDLTAGAPSTSNEGLRIIVAEYETVEQQCYLDDKAKEKGQLFKVKTYKISPSGIILNFNGTFEKSPNIINNGVFNTDYSQYIVDNVIQTPSSLYIYQTEGDSTEYIWHSQLGKYIPNYTKAEFEQKYEPNVEYKPYAHYYLTTARALRSFTNEQLSDPKLKLGVFLYTNDESLASKYVYLQDIQLTRLYRDSNNKVVTLGNIPTAISTEIDNYYLKPQGQTDSSEITTYGSLKFLAQELGIDEEVIQPVYNENSEKILSIQASQSNYFDILQSLCETFECWLDIRVAHEEDGSISLDKDFNPIKKIAFKEYAGKDNYAGFRNGINLSGITRNIDSTEIVTKLIVEPVQSEYSDSGSIDIQSAKSNPSGQSYILNLSYYLNRGLITNVEACNQDVLNYYIQTKAKNDEINKLQKEFIQLENSLTKISANRNVYTALIDEAEKDYNKAIQEFYEITGWEYDAFVSEYQNIEEWAVKEPDKTKDYLKNDTVVDVVGRIYTATTAINNCSGILTNLNEEYTKLSLKCYGTKDYGVSVAFIPGSDEVEEGEILPSTQVVVDDYISGLQFKLIDGAGAEVVYRTSPNDRIFNASNANPYTFICFTNLPTGYELQYYENNTPITLSDAEAKGFQFGIYDSVEEKAFNRRFSLIPKKDYATDPDHIGYQDRIDKLIEEKQSIEKNFYKKYSRFLQEGTWSSQDYVDPELYYLDALQVSNTSAQPKVNYTIEVLEVSQLDDLHNYDFRVGDKTYIEDTDFFGYLYQVVDGILVKTPVREEVIVSEVEWHFDEPDNNVITVQNYKTRFEDLFQRISAAVQTVQRNEITYPKTTSILDQSGLINSALLANSLNGIGGVGFALTTNESIAATDDGLLIRDLLNPANVMKLASNGLQVSTDGGDNWGTAISAEGISTDVLTAGTINTQKIWVMDGDNPSFRWDKAGLNAYGLDENGNQSYDLRTYVRFDKYGLYGIKNDENYVASSLDDVRNKAFFGVTWDGFFIKNSYTNDGEVSITSDDDIVVRKGDTKRIHIGAVEKDSTGAPTKYGIKIRNDDGEVVFNTGDDGNVTMTGTINAQAGIFSGAVSVGNPNNTHILIDGESDNPTISSSNYSDGAGTGWIIDSNGDATFSNVSVRGAIKTAVFEYEEIQAVGGAFLFRPSSTIKSARYVASEVTEEDDEGNPITFETYYHYENGEKVYNDLIVTVEKPLMFRENNWVKLSNYNELGNDPTAETYGLVHIYKVSETDFTPHPGETVEIIGEDGTVETITLPPTEPSYEITLAGGCAILDSVSINSIEGGALIDFGSHATKDGVDVPGEHNYGIGINSSDNYVNLPPRAISLFETTIHPNGISSENNAKVTYNYRGILGTLPVMQSGVDTSIYRHMQGTQGIYTDNMYLGDEGQFIAFYEDENHQKQLRIKANQIVFEVTDDEGQGTGVYHDINQIEAEGVPGPAGESAIQVIIDSNKGNTFLYTNETIRLTCKVIKGSSTDITSSVTHFNWYKIDRTGQRVISWSQPDRDYIDIMASDIDFKAQIGCEVTFD